MHDGDSDDGAQAPRPTVTEGSPARQRRTSSPAWLRLADLGATVYLGSVPEGLADELPGLYSSLFSTLDWFLAYDRKPPTGACVLDEPRHVILFHRDGDTVDVLNKSFACAPEDAQRICRALFRALPGVHLIHLSVMFPPEQLGLPWRLLERLDHMVIDLPGSVDEYYESLGKRTRKNVRWYQNRLSRAHPDLDVEVLAPGERSRELLDQLIAWKKQRFHRTGRVTYWETNATLADRMADLMRRCAEVRITSIAGKAAAIDICFRAGETAYIYEGAHDPRYDESSLGFLTFYWFVCSAIESGAARVNALEGTRDSKEPLGARPVRTTRVSVFRSRAGRLRSLDEALRVWRRRRISDYQRLRHSLGQKARHHRAGAALARFVTQRRVKRRSSS
jgi:CelD/BcsL family acetyltransferase involved in cellulose biosynthesis